MTDSIISNKRLGDELHKRGLLPKNCTDVRIRIQPSGALKIRYEVFVRASELANVVDAMKVVAEETAADDERNRIALQNKRPG